MQQSAWQLAQLNIATLSAPLDSPQLAGFVAKLDEINALAEASEGFVWRLISDEGESGEVDADGGARGSMLGDAMAIDHPFGPDVIVNMSVWDSIDALHAYVYRTAHTQVMARRKEWFSRMTDAYTVLWWVPEGHRPTPFEAERRLELLKTQGPSADAFTFKRAFPVPSKVSTACSQPSRFDDTCPA